MSDTDELIERATARLSGDRELQLDIAQELRAHMSDSAEEFLAAGYESDQAAAEAGRAFGDPDELADELWRANWPRMRARAAVRWSARAVLVPASLAIILAMGLHVYRTVQPGWFRRVSPSIYAGLTEDQVFFLCGDPNATNRVARAKSISDRWPNDPALYAQYVLEQANASRIEEAKRTPTVESMLEILDRGERIDPDNAWYNFLKASILAKKSCRLPDGEIYPFAEVYKNDRVLGIRKEVGRMEILDPAGFQRAIDEVFKGIAKPFCTAYRIELQAKRAELLGPPDGMAEVFHKTCAALDVPFPRNEQQVQFGRMLLAYAARQADAGDANALPLTHAVVLMAGMRGSRTDIVVEVLCSLITIGDALACREWVHRAMGQEEPAKADRAELERWVCEENRLEMAVNSGQRPDARRMGLFLATSGEPWSRPTTDSFHTPIKRLEHSLALQLGLLALLTALTVLGLVFSAAAVESLLARRADKGVLVFLGWRKTARILLLAVVAPLGLYALYAWAQFAPADSYGLNYSAGRVLLEWIAVIASVAVLLIGLSYRAIRRRAIELGLTVPPDAGRRWPDWGWLVAGTGVLLAAGYVIGWWLGPFKPANGWCQWSFWGTWYLPKPSEATHTGFVLAEGLAGLMVALVLAKAVTSARLAARYRCFRRTFYRSLAPILAASVVLVGLACSAALLAAEDRVAGSMVGRANLASWNEVEDTACQAYKTRLLDARARYLREWTQQAEPAPTEASAGDMRHSRANAECGKGDES